MITPAFFAALLLVAVIGYLLGSVNSAIIVSRLMCHDDVRRHGSGNAGMTNMLRTFGKGPAICTAVGDFLKGVVAVVLGRLLFSYFGLTAAAGFPVDAGYIGGLFALLGHVFPLYFKFKGGKGVMSALAIILVVNPPAFLVVAVIFIPLVFITRIVSLSSVIGSICFPFITWGLAHYRGVEPLYDTICAAVMSLLILYLHRENIGRLLNGTEHKFGQKPRD